MPTKTLKAWAKEANKTIDEAEACWEKAKDQASKKFKKEDEHFWAYVNTTTRKCLGLKDTKNTPKVLTW